MLIFEYLYMFICLYMDILI